MNGNEPLLTLSTCPDQEVAERLARELVTRQLAACVTIVPTVTSFYRWQGAVEQSPEILLLIKTTAGRWDELCDMLSTEHPYETPEIIAMPLTRSAAPYLAWLQQSVEEKTPCAG